MRSCIATVSIAGDFRQKVAAIAAAGFDGIEIFEQDFLAHDGTPRDAARMVRDHGLEIMLFQPFRDFEGLPEPHRARAFARAERKFDLMAELGTDLILICSSVHPLALGGIDRAAEDFRALGDIAAARGLRVGFEALAWGRHVNDHRDAWEVVRRADHENVGLILDSFHTLARRIPSDTIRSIPGDRIFFVQLADAPMIEMDLLYWSRHFRNMPGEGDLDVTGFMRAVVAAGYSGPLSLEIFNDHFRAGLPRLVAVDGHRSLIQLMDRVRRAEPALPVDVPGFPPPAPVEGVEFLEFVTSVREAPALGTLLESTGFGAAGRHVSKDITLWRQGGVNILVNTEEKDFAHAAYLAHGTTISEIGLAVPDATAAFSRAKALRAESFEQPVAAGELEIPAIRGVGGSMLRLIDRRSELGHLWEIDFRTDGGEHVGAGLRSVDHIAQTMPYDEMLNWALFYVSIFGAAKAPMTDVADPDGLVHSQAIRSGTLRLTLNGAESRRTLAGRFISDTLGASIQHIAFATDDIFATVERLTELNFAFLQMGPNYYDDLEARLGLEAAFVDGLRRANILYDRDDHGEFFQVYGLPLAGGLFFEIVERRAGYDGYGAPNAPFRIAAQKRLNPFPVEGH